MPKILQSYSKYMPGVIPRLQIQDNYLKQRYAKYMQGVIWRLQIQDNYLKQRYAKIWQRQLPKALSHLAVKAVIAVKALQLLNDLYKLS